MKTGGERKGPAREARYLAVYVRESHRDEVTERQASGLRRWPAMREWARERGLQLRWFKDLNVPASDRPEWKRLLGQLEAGQVAAVACWRLDRLGLTCSELVQFFSGLQGLGVDLMSQTEGFTLRSPVGEGATELLRSLAEFESEVRAERILAGQAAARARGVRWGGSVKGRRLKVTPELASRVRRLYSGGTKIAQIARETGLSRPTVYSVLADSAGGRRPARRPRQVKASPGAAPER